MKTEKFFIRKSKMAYENGDIYPIWGTCLGFEQLVVSIAQECILKPCQAKDKMSTLNPNWYWPHSEYISGLVWDVSERWVGDMMLVTGGW